MIKAVMINTGGRILLNGTPEDEANGNLGQSERTKPVFKADSQSIWKINYQRALVDYHTSDI